MKFRQLAIALLVLALPALAAGQSRAGAAAGAGAEATAQQLLAGNGRGVTKKARRLVRSQTELENLLQQIYSGQAPPPAPQIDFSRQVLVYYSLGTGMHGGDKVYIRSGSLHGGVLHVNVEVATSGGNCLGTTSLTAPFVLAALPFPAWKVHRAEFSVTHESYPCK